MADAVEPLREDVEHFAVDGERDGTRGVEDAAQVARRHLAEHFD